MNLIEDLLSDIKLRSFAPISQTTFSDSDLIDLCTRQMRSQIVPQIMRVREDFFQTTKSVSISASLARYTLPKDAIGGSFKGLYLQDSSGSRSALSRTDSERATSYAGQTGSPAKYYFEGDEVVLLPTPASGDLSLVFDYYARPNRLIATTSCAKITSESTAAGTTTYTVNTDLTASLSVGSKIDIISANSPFLLWAKEAVITAITSTTIAVSESSIENAAGTNEPQVGDYICPHGYANIPMVPEEWIDVLAQAVTVRLVRSLNDAQRFQNEMVTLREMMADATLLIQTRSESQPEYVSPNNPLMQAFSGRGWGGN